MDQAFFTLKRAHHATLKFSRRVLAQFEMTPARLDFLQAIALGECTQLDLRSRLGLSKASISEMLGELEKMGLVGRERCGRTKVVWLAPRGMEVFRRVLKTCVVNACVATAINVVLARGDWNRGALTGVCWYMRDAFGDTADWELYPRRPSGEIEELLAA